MDDLGTSYYDYYDDHEDYYAYDDDGEDLGPMLNFNVTRNNEYLDIFVSPASHMANISTNELLAGASRIAQAALNASPDQVRH